jgi:3-hydroxyisobutyrate dehydrogenase-like beta-hydroxyacid dehydrogenase
MKIGYIGLGNLGTPIAENILDKGHELLVFNRTASKTVPLVEKGAKACASVKELATECTIIFTMLADDAALKSVCGEQGLLEHLAPGSIHISMSTILPQTVQELHDLHVQKGLHYVACPVFGRPEAARARKLNFCISGKEELRRQAEPLLKDAGGIGVFDFGDVITAANTVKLCGNFAIASAIEAIGESVALAERSGVDPTQMWNMFTATLFNAPLYHTYTNIIINRKFDPPSFTLKLGLKDMKLVLQHADIAKQSMPFANLLKQRMEKLVSEGKDNVDWSAFGQLN